MKAYENREILLFMNPKELRDLANRMEELWVKLEAGDRTFVDFLHSSESFKIQLHLDQSYFEKMYRR